jgi:hypothetical protein
MVDLVLEEMHEQSVAPFGLDGRQRIADCDQALVEAA